MHGPGGYRVGKISPAGITTVLRVRLRQPDAGDAGDAGAVDAGVNSVSTNRKVTAPPGTRGRVTWLELRGADLIVS